MSANNWCLYMHTCPNGKVYIGITSKSPKDRWRNGRGYETNVLFNRAIIKYGWDNIEHDVLLDGLTKAQAEHYEIEFIKELESNNPAYGYNISSGGGCGSAGAKRPGVGKLIWETRRANGTDGAWNKGISVNGQPVCQYDKGGAFIALYASTREAERITKIRRSHISECCSMKRKTAGGFVWRYK